MKFHYALVALAVACTGDVTGDKSGDTGPGTGTGCPGGRYTGPVEITDADVECTGNEVRFSMETKGLTSDGIVFSQETGNVEPNWSDNHTLVSYEFDSECNSFDRLERVIDDGSTLNNPLQDWQQDVSSVFRCDDHYTDAEVMTYAFAAYDQQGALADCVVIGDNPQGLINGNFDNAGDDPDFNLSNCSAGIGGA